MDAEETSKFLLRKRPPPDRTYAFKRRPGPSSERENKGKGSLQESSTGELTVQDASSAPQRDGFTSPTTIVSFEVRRQPTVRRAPERKRLLSVEEMGDLVHRARMGGQEGERAAVALARACKFRDVRERIHEHGGSRILSNILNVVQTMLQSGAKNARKSHEGIVHCLAVVLFILSKDRMLARDFSATAVSTLALLIERGQKARIDRERHFHDKSTEARFPISSLKPSDCGREHSSFLGLPRGKKQLEGPTDHPRRPSANRSRYGTIEDRTTTSLPLPAEKNLCEDRDSLAVSLPAESRGDGDIGSDGSEEGDASTKDTRRAALCADSANATVHARMLLDIVDMLPWGLANRHLVSAADLGLATMLNVASRRSPDGVARAGDDDINNYGTFTEEGMSTHVSADSQGQHRTDSNERSLIDEKAATNVGVIAELSRLGRSGFLLPLVVQGSSILEKLSAVDLDTGREFRVDPSTIRAMHQLVLSLRILNLATVQSFDELNGIASGAGRGGVKGPSAKLSGALLRVVAQCQSLMSSRAVTRDAEASPRFRRQSGREGLDVDLGGRRSRLANDIADKIRDIMLAALRVLVNLTHDNVRVCAEVARRGGLRTLLSCLVAHSNCGVQSSSDEESDACRADAERESRSQSGTGTNVYGGDETGTGGRGDFDAQILAMGALINCVELEESAANRTAMAELHVGAPAPNVSDSPQRSSTGRSASMSAPVYLARLLLTFTGGFASEFDDDRADETREEAVLEVATEKDADDGIDATSDPTAAVVATAALAPTDQLNPSSKRPITCEEEDDKMSHSEGANLVLGGHCALLLGLLMRGLEESRRLALPVLPDRSPTLIIRVLEAFMALQYQAGVLTEEVVLKVQSLVQALEEIEGTSEDYDPSSRDIDSEGDGSAPSVSLQTNKTSEPRTDNGPGVASGNTSIETCRPTPTSGKWTRDAGGSDAGRDARPARGRRGLIGLARGDASSSSAQADSFWGSTTRREQYTPRKQSSGVDPPVKHPESDSVRWSLSGAGGTVSHDGSEAVMSLGLRGSGTSALSNSSWLAASQRRTYGRQIPFGRQIWTDSRRSLPTFGSPSFRTASALAGRRKWPRRSTQDTGVFDMKSDASDDEDPLRKTLDFNGNGNGDSSSGGRGSGFGGGGGEGRRFGGISGGATSGRSRLARSAKSIFDLDCSSDEDAIESNARQGVHGSTIKHDDVSDGALHAATKAIDGPAQRRPRDRRKDRLSVPNGHSRRSYSSVCETGPRDVNAKAVTYSELGDCFEEMPPADTGIGRSNSADHTGARSGGSAKALSENVHQSGPPGSYRGLDHELNARRDSGASIASRGDGRVPLLGGQKQSGTGQRNGIIDKDDPLNREGRGSSTSGDRDVFELEDDSD